VNATRILVFAKGRETNKLRDYAKKISKFRNFPIPNLNKLNRNSLIASLLPFSRETIKSI